MNKRLPSTIDRKTMDALCAGDTLVIIDGECPWSYKLKALERAREWLMASPQGFTQLQVAVREYEPAKFVVCGYDYGCEIEPEIRYLIGVQPEARYQDLCLRIREGCAAVLNDRIRLFAGMAAA